MNDDCSRVSVYSNEVVFDDTEMPFRDSDDDCVSETSQIFIENPIDGIENYFSDSGDELLSESSQIFLENPLPLYYQIGSGFSNNPGPSTAGPVFIENTSYYHDNLEDAIILEERSRRRNSKYRAEEIIFRARVDPDHIPRDLREMPLTGAVDSVRQLFQQLIRRSTQDLGSTDLIRFCIQADTLDKPISTHTMPVSELTIEKLLSVVMKVLQSKEEIKLDVGFSVDIIKIKRDIGAGRSRRIANIEIDRLQKKSIIAVPTNEEGLCCAMAIVYAVAYLDKNRRAINALRDRRRTALLKRAKELHEEAGVPLGACTYAEISKFEEHLNIQIVVFSSENLNKVSYKGRDRPRRINLWLHSEHYDVIKNLKGFYGSDFYCEKCEKAYVRLEDHRCENACHICLRSICEPFQPIRCNDCDRLCRSAECFEEHKRVSGNQIKSICDRVYQCRKCCRVIKRRDCPRENHCCGTVRCPSCENFVVAAEHRCFLRTIKSKKPSDRLIFFDFETDQATGEHIVNFAVAQYIDASEHIFKGYRACEEFCNWLFSPIHKDFTAIAHNMKGFDGQFILAWLLKQGIAPEVVPNGSKLMAITHKALSIRIIDSFNFLPMALSKFPTCFGFSELQKGYFPHLFNTSENQNYVGPLPDIKFYSPNTMSTSAREAFMAWHREHKNDVFNFQDEMLAYCRSDVDILRRCCIEFRNQFLEISGVDPYCYITIAAACMAIYRSKHIKPKTIAMVPVRGYVNSTNYSSDAIRWLDFTCFSEGLFIQHALNGSGEKKIAGISVDGYCAEIKTVYQYQGCFFHGCPTCYDRDSRNPLLGITMGALKERTDNTTAKIRSLGFKVIEKWEHEFSIEKKENTQLQTFLESHTLQDRLNPRDAFFGGRTNAVKLYYEGEAKYVDFTSLYPWVNKYCKYPVGHPQVITENFGSLDQYFGLIKCRVIAPCDLYLPVLPLRSNGKLLFPLCKTCAENMQQARCQHTESERAIIGTWVTEEVKMAVSKGYKITNIFEVYHFTTTSDSLFRSYIDLFLKIKQESSGWPADCETLEDRALYIKSYEERENIILDPKFITKNPGRRQVAKLALNSFWGRWGMNCNKGQLTYVQSVPDFNKVLLDPTKKVKDIYLPTPEVAAIHWERKKDFLVQDSTTNIFLAVFTTAWARLKLYAEMDKLGRTVLYHDTDSIIYASNGTNDPPLGNFLGDFTDELDGDKITTFVSGGPKNYAYKTAGGKTCCKVRGFTLNYGNAQLLNFDAIKNLISSMDRESTISIENPSKIVREVKKRKVINKREKKLYKIVYDKRVILEDLSTLPYGYQ